MNSILVCFALLSAVSAQLYGVTLQNQLVTLDADLTGNWTLVGHQFAKPTEFVTLVQVADVDVSNGTMYIIGFDKTSNAEFVVGLSLYSGQVVTKHVLPFHFDFDYISTPGLDYIPNTHDILVYGADAKTRIYKIYRITPSTGVSTLITNFTYPNFVLQSIDTYDSVNELLWIQLSGNHMLQNLAFDVNSGKLVWNITDVYGLLALNFNPVDGLIYGVASTESSGMTQLVTLDSTTGLYTVVGELLNEVTAAAGPQNAGLDYNNNVLYMYLESAEEDDIFAYIPLGNPSKAMRIPTNANSVIPATIVFANE